MKTKIRKYIIELSIMAFLLLIFLIIAAFLELKLCMMWAGGFIYGFIFSVKLGALAEECERIPKPKNF